MSKTQQEEATFAAGCFWGVEEVFRMTDGVLDATVGYTGGHTENPTYEEVCTGTTGHAEAVHLVFDPSKVSYEQLLSMFWKIHNPTTPNRQGPDIGTQYRSVIFYNTEKQRELAQESKESIEASDMFNAPVVTEIVPAGPFYPAEEYHQQFFAKHGGGTCRI